MYTCTLYYRGCANIKVTVTVWIPRHFVGNTVWATEVWKRKIIGIWGVLQVSSSSFIYMYSHNIEKITGGPRFFRISFDTWLLKKWEYTRHTLYIECAGSEQTRSNSSSWTRGLRRLDHRRRGCHRVWSWGATPLSGSGATPDWMSSRCLARPCRG
jgi:hypothetical protein